MLDFTLKLLGEKAEVFGSPGEQQGRASRFYRPNKIIGDHVVACLVIDECSVNILDRGVAKIVTHPKVGYPWDHPMFMERSPSSCERSD
jgi:hypothetical protein